MYGKRERDVLSKEVCSKKGTNFEPVGHEVTRRGRGVVSAELQPFLIHLWTQCQRLATRNVMAKKEGG